MASEPPVAQSRRFGERWWLLLRRPSDILRETLAEQPAVSRLLLHTVVPLASLRPATEVVRSVVGGDLGVGVVLAIGSFMLHLGLWLVISLTLPAVARQFSIHLDEGKAASLVSHAMVPWWLASVLYIIPESPPWLHLWSRFLVGLAAGYGLYIVHCGAACLPTPAQERGPFVLATAVVTATVYALLFFSLGLGATLTLLLLGV